MKRESMLVVGIGQCGCTLANLMKIKSKRYTPIFINSSAGDFKGLDNVNKNNSFVYSGADGSGRNRAKAKEFIKSDQVRLGSFLKKYMQFEYATIFFSTDGGTGSGTAINTIKSIKALNKRMKINVVAVLPRLGEDNLQLNNSLECCSELSSVSEIINDVKFIDNDNGESYDEINRRAINDIDMAYSLQAHSEIGSIDESNLENVCLAQGYGVILNLPKHYNSIEESLTTARENSIFAIPNILDCSYGAVSLIKSDYEVEMILDELIADETIYKAYGDKVNAIVLGGCDFPNERLKDMEAELNDREMKKGSRKRNKGFSFTSKTTKTQEEDTSKELNYIDDEDLESLFEDDFIL